MNRDVWLWIGVTLGPLAWFGNLVLGDAMDPGVHLPRDPLPFLALHGSAFVLAIASAAIGWRMLNAPSMSAGSRVRFMAMASVALGVLSALLVIGTALPTLILVAGAEP